MGKWGNEEDWEAFQNGSPEARWKKKLFATLKAQAEKVVMLHRKNQILNSKNFIFYFILIRKHDT